MRLASLHNLMEAKEELIRGIGKPFSQVTPRDVYYFCLDYGKVRWRRGEEIIKRSPAYAYAYARDILRGRFPEAENAMSKDTEVAFNYAIHFVGERWPEGEEAIKKSKALWGEYLNAFDIETEEDIFV